MSIDAQSETLITLSEARTAFPGGRRLAMATMHRWKLRGVGGVRLETILIGGLRYTSREAIARFINAQNVGESPSSTISPAQRLRQAKAAQLELTRAGI